MAITLRTIKGEALTHIEMDTNLTSYYVSSSLDGTILSFYTHGTGSFSATTHSVDLSSFLDDTDNQNLTIVGDQLTIERGNTVTIPTGSDTTYSNLSEFINDVGYITSFTDTNTEYTAGTGLTLTGTEFSLTNPHFSGDYNDLTNKPTNVSEFTNDAGYITASALVDLSNLVEKTSVQALASTSALSFSGSIVTLTKGDGTTDSIDLVTIQDTNLARIIEGRYLTSSQELEFTRDDSTTFTIDASYLLDNTNLVTSVNGLNGGVVLTTDNVAEGSTNFYDKEVSFVGQNITINGTYPNFQLTGSNGAVTSVNGQTGDVTLSLFDGDYNSLTSVPTNVSEFTNDAGYITGYTEVDTLATVTGRGNTTSTSITAANFITTSDERLKSNIKPIASGLETLKKFVSYEYVKDGIQDAGFLAQEVQEAIPYSIGEREDGYLTMRDRPVLAHMHKAILELEARLAAIEEKLQ